MNDANLYNKKSKKHFFTTNVEISIIGIWMMSGLVALPTAVYSRLVAFKNNR